MGIDKDDPANFNMVADLDTKLEKFVYNDAINRWFLANMLVGDLRNFVKYNKNGKPVSNEKEIIKRMGGAVTPINVVPLGKDLRVVILEDIYIDDNGALFEGTSEEAEAKGYTQISDAQSYVNNFVGSKIRKTGGNIDDYGYTYKTIYNNATGDGEFNYIKTSSVSFENVEDLDSINDTKERSIAKFLKRFKNEPVMVAFRSSLKSPLSKNAKLYTITELTEKTELTENDLALSDSGFGIQLNINKDVSKKDSDIALSTQASKIITTFIPDSIKETIAWERLLASKINRANG